MRVLLSASGARGCVEPVGGRAVRVCAPPDEEFAERPAGVGVPPVRPRVQGARFRPAAGVPHRAAELIAEQFGTVAAVAEGCEALVLAMAAGG